MNLRNERNYEREVIRHQRSRGQNWHRIRSHQKSSRFFLLSFAEFKGKVIYESLKVEALKIGLGVTCKII